MFSSFTGPKSKLIKIDKANSTNLSFDLDSDWIRYLLSRLEDLQTSESEMHNVEIIGFSWPKTMHGYLLTRCKQIRSQIEFKDFHQANSAERVNLVGTSL